MLLQATPILVFLAPRSTQLPKVQVVLSYGLASMIENHMRGVG